MSSLKSLLNKIDVFEKLALYGRRKDFLKSFAQTDPGFERFLKYYTDKTGVHPSPEAMPDLKKVYEENRSAKLAKLPVISRTMDFMQQVRSFLRSRDERVQRDPASFKSTAETYLKAIESYKKIIQNAKSDQASERDNPYNTSEQTARASANIESLEMVMDRLAALTNLVRDAAVIHEMPLEPRGPMPTPGTKPPSSYFPSELDWKPAT